jgi:hypothetical protein
MLPVLVGMIVCGFLGYAVAHTRNQGGLGLVLGLLLGPLGILVAALLPRQEPAPGPRGASQGRSLARRATTDPVDAWEARERDRRKFSAPPRGSAGDK